MTKCRLLSGQPGIDSVTNLGTLANRGSWISPAANVGSPFVQRCDDLPRSPRTPGRGGSARPGGSCGSARPEAKGPSAYDERTYDARDPISRMSSACVRGTSHSVMILR